MGIDWKLRQIELTEELEEEAEKLCKELRGRAGFEHLPDTIRKPVEEIERILKEIDEL